MECPIGFCVHCFQRKAVVIYHGLITCLDCRRVDIERLPPLPETHKTRREIPVVINEKTYRFRSKAEAKRTARAILHRERLPSEIVQQIEGRR